MSEQWRVTSDKRARGFRDLLLWQKGMELGLAIYPLSEAAAPFALIEELRKMLNSLRRKRGTRH